jgi:hypothetical protein
MKLRSPRRGRTIPNHPVGSLVLAALLAFVLATVLGACSLFATPPTPTSVTTAATALQDSLRKTAGITGVKVSVAPRDEKDGGPLDSPGAWRITANVTAQTPAIGVHPIVSAIENQLDTARHIATAIATLWFRGDSLPDAALDFASGGSGSTVTDAVDEVMRLRTLTGIQAVQVSIDGPPPNITVGSTDRWPATVRQLRALDGFGNGLLTAVTVNNPDPVSGWITVGTSTPDDATLAGLGEVVNQPGVTWLSYDAVRPSNSGDDWRPELSVDTRSRSARAAALSWLTSFDQHATPISGIPRARFQLNSTVDGTGHETDGYLGLPLGSAEPHDLVPASRPTPVPADSAAEAAKLAANLKLVQTLLDDAGTTAGIRGTPSIGRTSCAAGPGTQVNGTVLIPIFKVTDSANAAYAAIIASWTSQGYTNEDHAAGTELRTGGPLNLLTIRGTPHGLIVTATSNC